MSRRLVTVVMVLALLAVFATSAFAGSGRNFVAFLEGKNEVPARETTAQGIAVFHLDRSGEELRYKLIVNRLTNTWMAHIHLAPAGSNGQIVVWLHPETPPPPPGSIAGMFNGLLHEGVITQSDLVGPLAGKTMADLMAAIAAGNTYVNVHTNDFVNPANTGPGDFPGGEIRGTIVPAGRGSADDLGFDDRGRGGRGSADPAGDDHGNH